MNNEHDTERLFVGRCALILFIGGLLVPFILAALVLAVGDVNLSSKAESIAHGLCVGFGLVAELLALILGTIGRRHLSGKIAQVGVIVLLAACVVVGASASAVWFVRSLPPRPEPAKKAHVSPGVTPKEAGR